MCASDSTVPFCGRAYIFPRTDSSLRFSTAIMKYAVTLPQCSKWDKVEVFSGSKYSILMILASVQADSELRIVIQLTKLCGLILLEREISLEICVRFVKSDIHEVQLR